MAMLPEMSKKTGISKIAGMLREEPGILKDIHCYSVTQEKKIHGDYNVYIQVQIFLVAYGLQISVFYQMSLLFRLFVCVFL